MLCSCRGPKGVWDCQRGQGKRVGTDPTKVTVWKKSWETLIWSKLSSHISKKYIKPPCYNSLSLFRAYKLYHFSCQSLSDCAFSCSPADSSVHKQRIQLLRVRESKQPSVKARSRSHRPWPRLLTAGIPGRALDSCLLGTCVFTSWPFLSTRRSVALWL